MSKIILIIETAVESRCKICYDEKNRLPREPEKCRITQDILCRVKRLECSTTWCNARERHKAAQKIQVRRCFGSFRGSLLMI